MHFCADEMAAITATLIFARPAWVWLKSKIGRKR